MNKTWTILKIVFPALLWIILFYKFLVFQAMIGPETYYLYGVIKFYLDHIALGQFPLWNPFVMWGTPTQIYFNYAGVFNPIWWVMALLKSCGVASYPSFIVTICLYFGLGQWGFYLLAKTLLKDHLAAYTAFLLFLFSSMSLALFAQLHEAILYIPSIWFFYFLFKFIENNSRWAWGGVFFSLGIILTTYLPFYFFTVFIAVILVASILGYKHIGRILKSSLRFIRENMAWVIFSLGLLVMTFIPGYQAYRSTLAQDIVAPFRNYQSSQKAGVDFADYEQVKFNSLCARMQAQELYSDLDIIRYGDDGFFYASIILYLLLLGGLWLRLNKKLVGLGVLALGLFLILITSGSGLHHFLFNHVFCFKLIRNMHFFLPFFLGMIILFAAELLRLLLARQFAFQCSKLWGLAVVLVGHVLILIFLLTQENIALVSYCAIVLSAVFWTGSLLLQKQSGVILESILILGILIQPVWVMSLHNLRALDSAFNPQQGFISQSVKTSAQSPVWEYSRPQDQKTFANNESIHSWISMKDAAQFYSSGFPVTGSYRLAQTVPPDLADRYAQNKFYVYDGVYAGDCQSMSPGELEQYLSDHRRRALICPGAQDKDLAENLSDSLALYPRGRKPINGSTQEFIVRNFHADSLEINTNFSQNKFLVYTNSFQRFWKVKVNGQSQKIFATSLAFQGIFLPAGNNDVQLYYDPPGVKTASVLAILALNMLLILTILFYFREKLFIHRP